MADAPDNLVHVLLREIRAKQDEHTARFDQLEARLNRIEHNLDSIYKTATKALGWNSKRRTA